MFLPSYSSGDSDSDNFKIKYKAVALMEDDSGAKHRLKAMQAKTPLIISQQIR